MKKLQQNEWVIYLSLTKEKLVCFEVGSKDSLPPPAPAPQDSYDTILT